MAGLTGTGAANIVLGADHGRRAGSRGRLLRAGAHRRLLGGGLRRARGGRDRLRHVRGRVPVCSPTPTCWRTRTDHSHTYRREWTDPYGLMGPPGAFGLLSRAYEAKYGLDYRMLGKLAVTQRNHAHHERERLRKAARADHHRRLHELAHDRRSDPAAGLRDAGRRRGRPDHDEPQARQGKGPDQEHHSDRLCRAHQLLGRREPGRRDQERPRDLRQEGARARPGSASRT